MSHIRCKGYAKNLLSECEKWAKSHNCVEFASDCSIDNADNILFYKRTGFNISNKIICFIKKIK